MTTDDVLQGVTDFHTTVRRETLISGISNTLFNALAAWLLFKDGGDITFIGERGFAVDLVATAFILPFIVTLIVIPINQRKRAKNKIAGIPLNNSKPLHRVLGGLPQGLWSRAGCIGLLSMLLVTPLTLLPLWALGVHEFTPGSYALFKGLWAGLIAALLTTPLLLLALKEN